MAVVAAVGSLVDTAAVEARDVDAMDSAVPASAVGIAVAAAAARDVAVDVAALPLVEA